jgi:hypothetical protein
MQLHLGMRREEGVDLLGFVRGQIVHDDMQGPPPRLMGHEVPKKAANSAEVGRSVVVPGTSPMRKVTPGGMSRGQSPLRTSARITSSAFERA